MNKSILAFLLLGTLSLSGCEKKEEESKSGGSEEIAAETTLSEETPVAITETSPDVPSASPESEAAPTVETPSEGESLTSEGSSHEASSAAPQ